MNVKFSKKILFIAIAIIVFILIVIIGGMWWTGPKRTLNAFLKATEQGKRATAIALVSDKITSKRMQNVQFFLDDWTRAKTISIKTSKEESWRSRITTQDDPNTKKNEELIIQTPTPKYWAHSYHAFVTVTFDDIEDPVIITLARTTENTSSIFAQLFRSWKVTRIQYQPLDEDAVIDLSDESLEFDDSLLPTNDQETNTNEEATNSSENNVNVEVQ